MEETVVKSAKRIAEDLAGLLIWALILVFLFIFTRGLIWDFIKFIGAVILILGVRDWFIDWTLFKVKNRLN